MIRYIRYCTVYNTLPVLHHSATPIWQVCPTYCIVEIYAVANGSCIIHDAVRQTNKHMEDRSKGHEKINRESALVSVEYNITQIGIKHCIVYMGFSSLFSPSFPSLLSFHPQTPCLLTLPSYLLFLLLLPLQQNISTHLPYHG